MFTGIIESVGEVLLCRTTETSGRFGIKIPRGWSLGVGESIAVNGVCLTASLIENNTASFDIGAETIRKTSFRMMRTGDKVNLERAMRADGRLSGHFVTGHVDGAGTIEGASGEAGSAGQVVLKISATTQVMEYLVPQGCIAVDGVSLTVAKLGKDYFEVCLIPQTLKSTTLRYKRVRDIVNLEADILGKYVFKAVARSKPPGKITAGFLRENGF